MATFIEEVGGTVQDIITGIGDNYSNAADDGAARAKYNAAVADLISAKARSQTKQSDTVSKAVNTAVVGLLVILGIFVIAKYVVPQFK